MLKTKLVTAALASVVAALAAVPSAHAATEYFMKLEVPANEQPIKGEVTDKELAGAIQIDAFGWAAANQATVGSGTDDVNAGKTQLKELTVEKAVDSTTPVLFQRLAQGKHFRSVEIIARQAGTSPSVIPTRYLFQTVSIKAQQQGGSSGDDAPRETLTFLYSAVAQQAVRPAAPGTAAARTFGNWNQITSTLIKEPLPADYR